MINDKTFDNFVRKALSEGEDKVQLDTALIPEVKSRLILQKGRDKTNMSRIKNLTGTRFGKIAATCCSMVLVLALSFTFIQPVRAIGEKGIGKIKSMVYDVIKGKDGKYIAVKVPYTEPKKAGSTTHSGEKKTIIGEDLLLKIPRTLAGGYSFDNQGFGNYDSKSGSLIMLSAKDKVPDKFKEVVSVYYGKGKSQIVLEMSYLEIPFALNMKHEPISGDNKKSLAIGDIKATYAEYPGVRYPIKNETEDRTQKPNISILHTIKWKQNGVYYTIYDFNGDLSQNVLKAAAETVIQSMK
jgi:hypothetical protein